MKKITFHLLFLTLLLSSSLNSHAQNTYTWTGASNTTAWATTGNWIGPIGTTIVSPPGSNDTVIIGAPQGLSASSPAITTTIVIAGLQINNNGSLTLTEPGSLEIVSFGDFDGATTVQNGGLMTLNSGSSFTTSHAVTTSGNGNIDIDALATFTLKNGASLLTPPGIIDGNVAYERSIPGRWYLVSSPVIGENVADIISQNNLATSGSKLGFAPFSSAANAWEYATAGSNYDLTPAQGYSILLASGAPTNTVSFTGTVNTFATNSYSLTTGNTTAYDLIGNPYMAYVNGSNFVVSNAANLKEPTIYLWKGGTNYVSENVATAYRIAPAQGFFVELKGDIPNPTADMVFDFDNQEHRATDTFTKEEATSNFELFIENKNDKRSTRVFYIDGRTTGYDSGYDSKMFDANYEFAVFTELVSDNEGKQLAIQTLPKNDTSIIPVGVIANAANAGEEITFSIESTNLPEGVNVSLEDSVTGVFTNLSEDTYTTTLKEAVNGVGQFYVHIASKTLNTNNSNIENISVYKSSSNEITISGLNTDATFTMFSLLGKQVLQTKVATKGVHKVSLPDLSAGIYLIKLDSSLGSITKKIVLN
jgi:hypothetical protein